MREQDFLWKRRTAWFLVSQCITLFGSTLVQMAIVWYATLETAKGFWVAAFSIAAYLPQFLMSFIGGAWADRYARKKLIIIADALIAGVTLLMVVLFPCFKDERLLLSVLLLLTLLRSLGAGVQTPAVNATLPDLVPTSKLLRVNGINASMQAVVNFAAPAAAGAVMVHSSLRAILMIDVLTAVLGIGLLLLIALPCQKTVSQTKVFQSIGHGLCGAFGTPQIRSVLFSYGCFTFLCVPAGFLAGLYVRRVFGDTYWYLTLVELVGFAGMCAGGLVMSLWGGFQKCQRTLSVGLTFFGVCAIMMGVVDVFALYLFSMLCYGVAMTMVQTSLTTLLQETAPQALQGRVFGFMSSMYAGALPLGMAVFGPLADYYSLSGLMILSGIAALMMAFANRGVRL